MTLEEMRAAIEEARKAGRRTAAHAMAATGISEAIDAGITSIEHGVFLTRRSWPTCGATEPSWCRP